MCFKQIHLKLIHRRDERARDVEEMLKTTHTEHCQGRRSGRIRDPDGTQRGRPSGGGHVCPPPDTENPRASQRLGRCEDIKGLGGAGGGGTVTGEGEDNATRAADEGFGDAARGAVCGDEGVTAGRCEEGGSGSRREVR